MTSQTFVGEQVSVRAARRFVNDHLARHGIDASVATLLTSELASNVVQHACTDFDITVTVDKDIVRVEIHDGIAVSEAFRDLIDNPPLAVEATSVRGRGLLLVGATATRFGLTDKGPRGKALWFEIARPEKTPQPATH